MILFDTNPQSFGNCVWGLIPHSPVGLYMPDGGFFMKKGRRGITPPSAGDYFRVYPLLYYKKLSFYSANVIMKEQIIQINLKIQLSY